MKKILIYSPFQGIAEYSFPLSKIAESLKKTNSSVDLLLCSGLQIDTCYLQISHHKELISLEEKIKMCKWCKGYSKDSSKHFDNVVSLDESSLTSTELIQINKVIFEIKKEEVEDFQIDEIPIARIACYNFLIRFQITNFQSVTDEQFNIFKEYYLTSVLKTFYAYKKILSQNDYSVVVLSDPNYSLNQIVVKINEFEKVRSIAVFPTHHHRYFYDHYLLCYGDQHNHASDIMKGFEKRKLNSRKSREIALDYLEALWNERQKFIFSSPKTNLLAEVREKCGILPEHKKVVVLVTSSLDESYATDFSVYKSELWTNYEFLFENQETWIEECVKHFRKMKGVKLIIRCHPREHYLEKTATSLEIERLSLKYSSDSIYFNFSSDDISVFDLLNISDVCLVRASSVGVQAGILGIPTISYLKNNRYYPNFFNPATNLEYFETIDSVLEKDDCRDIRFIEMQFQWLMYYYGEVSFKISSNKYWEIYPKTSAKEVEKKKLRIQKNLPVHEIDTYLNTAVVDEENELILHKYINDHQEVWKSYEELSIDSYEKEDITVLIKDLIKSIYGKDIHNESDLIFLTELMNQNKTLQFYFECLKN
ncbi:MAG: hypothetical protein KC646_06075 [Candidatus Cloacimonetes bacterium]|nr:hypothetical protein [Candidatus Cloacimonadota bacterium]